MIRIYSVYTPSINLTNNGQKILLPFSDRKRYFLIKFEKFDQLAILNIRMAGCLFECEDSLAWLTSLPNQTHPPGLTGISRAGARRWFIGVVRVSCFVFVKVKKNFFSKFTNRFEKQVGPFNFESSTNKLKSNRFWILFIIKSFDYERCVKLVEEKRRLYSDKLLKLILKNLLRKREKLICKLE